MNILMLTDYFPPHIGGGVERAVYELSRRLAIQGHRVTVLTMNTRRALSHEVWQGMEVIRVPALDLTKVTGMQVAVSLHAWPRLRRLLKKRRFDLVHTHNVFFHLSLAGALVARASHVPLVTTAHLGSVSDLGGGVSRVTSLYEHTVGTAILKLSAHVIAVSQAVADHVATIGASANATTVITNGVDARLFAPAVPADHQLRKVVFVGRLIFNKGPQYLVDAMPDVLARFPDAEFDFIGDGPLRQELEREVATIKASQRVRFLGECREVAPLLRGGAILVRPSLSEGLPLTVLEGMACGLPVVATPVGGTPEVVTDGVNGYLVPPGDVPRLAGRICDLLADAGLRRQMGREGRLLVEQGYDWDDISRRTAQVYRQAIRARGGGRV